MVNAEAMLNPQLLHHLEAFEEKNDRSGTITADGDGEEGWRGVPLSHRRVSTLHPLSVRKWLIESSDRHLSYFTIPNVQVAVALLVGVSLAPNGFGILWNLSVASLLMWTFLKSRSVRKQDPTVEPWDARILESRRTISTLLASVGAPPLSPLLPPAGDVSASRQPPLDRSLNHPSDHQSAQSSTRDDDADRVLHLLERFTCQNVALIRRVDELVDWIRDATALRFLGTGSAPTPSRGPSVERVERSAASKLMRQRAARQNDDKAIDSQQHWHQESALAHTLESLPLSSLRRNIATVGLQHLHVLCFCLRGCEHAQDENDLDDERPQRQLDVPDVVTLSWIRSLRCDLVQAFHCVVEETLSDLTDRNGQPATEIGGTKDVIWARPSHQAMHRAVSAAEEGISFLQAYPRSCVFPNETSTRSADGNELGADLLWRLGKVQNQCDALTTALLTLRESIFSGSYPGVQHDRESQTWWTEIRELSSQISTEVEALDADLKLSGDEGRQGGASTSDSPPDDDHHGRADSSHGNAENEYVLIDVSSDGDDEAVGREQCDEESSKTSRNESRTLIYSGQGCVARSPKQSLRPAFKRVNVASRHAPLDPTLLYQSLYEELRGRLGRIELDEVDASAPLSSPADFTDDEETTDSNRAFPTDLDPPLCCVERERVPATFLAELRGAIQGDSPIAGAGSAWDK